MESPVLIVFGDPLWTVKADSVGQRIPDFADISMLQWQPESSEISAVLESSHCPADNLDQNVSSTRKSCPCSPVWPPTSCCIRVVGLWIILLETEVFSSLSPDCLNTTLWCFGTPWLSFWAEDQEVPGMVDQSSSSGIGRSTLLDDSLIRSKSVWTAPDDSLEAKMCWLEHAMTFCTSGSLFLHYFYQEEIVASFDASSTVGCIWLLFEM